MKKRYEAIRAKYSGKPYLCQQEFRKKFPENDDGQIWFIGTMTDMFAQDVPAEQIKAVLDHLSQFPGVKFLFQSKNPKRFCDFDFPKLSILCTTIESNRDYPGMSLAPKVMERTEGLSAATEIKNLPGMITIEPVINFDVKELLDMILYVGPYQVNIGSDSKRNKLPEPTWDKIEELIRGLRQSGIAVHLKDNLKRLVSPDRSVLLTQDSAVPGSWL
jgi:hypothetical protein